MRAWHAAPDSLLALARREGRPAWTEYIHLLWTMWVFIVPAFSPRGYDLQWTLLTVLSYPAFLALYFAALRVPQRRVVWPAAGMLALSLGLLPWYGSGLSYFVFGCVYLGSMRWRSSLQYVVVLLGLGALLLAWGRLLHYPWSALAWMPVTTLMIGLLVHVDRLKRTQDAALRLSHDEVRRLAAVAERERIGRDLHDLLGHTLSLVALKADLASRLVMPDPGAAQREIDEVAGIARDALAQVRQAVSGIRAAGLAAELAAARLLLEIDGIALDVAFDPEAVGADLAPAVETALALTLREGVTNLQRHAGARRARVEFTRVASAVHLRIVDDGRGGAMVPGNGLSGMRERIESLGGHLRVDGAPGRTLLEAVVPASGMPA